MPSPTEAEHCWKLLLRLSELLLDIGAQADQAMADKVTLAQKRVLSVVFSHAPQSVMLKDIALELNLTPGAISQTIDALVKADMLERCPDEHDRRALAIRPTEKWEAHRQRYRNEVTMHTEHFLQEIPQADCAVFLRVLEHFKNQADAQWLLMRKGELER